MKNPKVGGLHIGKRWVKIPDGTKVRFCGDGREGGHRRIDRIGCRFLPESG